MLSEMDMTAVFVSEWPLMMHKSGCGAVSNLQAFPATFSNTITKFHKRDLKIIHTYSPSLMENS